jgi:RNA polymerase sigma-70 factor (ECF subfamily)
MKLFVQMPAFIYQEALRQGDNLMQNTETERRFGEVYESTNKAVLAFITAKCSRSADIADIFQDTYMELYRLLMRRGTDYVTNDKALVMRIAKRKLARYYSLLARLRIIVSKPQQDDDEDCYTLEDVSLEGGGLEDTVADGFLTEEFVVNQSLLESAKDYLRSKPEIVQKVFYLHFDSDMTIKETAEALGISESSVKNKLYRTLNELRALLS